MSNQRTGTQSNPLSEPGSPTGVTGPAAAASTVTQTPITDSPMKKKKHRGGRKSRRNRRKSFAGLAEDMEPEASPSPAHEFYSHGRNPSVTSLESEALLDHRDIQYNPRARRGSLLPSSVQPTRNDREREQRQRSSHSGATPYHLGFRTSYDREDDDAGMPLLGNASRQDVANLPQSYGSTEGRHHLHQHVHRESSRSSSRRNNLNNNFTSSRLIPSYDYDINYPPSMPPSPRLRAADLDMGLGDVMIREDRHMRSRSPSVPESDADLRKHVADGATLDENDVDTSQRDAVFQLADEGERQTKTSRHRRFRRRRPTWPDLSVLEGWSQAEKESRTDDGRRRKMTREPHLIDGRLRPVHRTLYMVEEEAPYRFTYFNEELESTIHAPSISDLVQPELSFRDLFIPDPAILSDDSDVEDCEVLASGERSIVRGSTLLSTSTMNGDPHSRAPSRPPSLPTPAINVKLDHHGDGIVSPKLVSEQPTPSRVKSPKIQAKSSGSNSSHGVRYGERPVWWLDVLSPTESEMKVLERTFDIHPLTSEDIMQQEQREKLEMFPGYYFLNYRSFDQNEKSETYLQPVNFYWIVFREGVISFHFSPTPHPNRVRHRVRQLMDHMDVTGHLISYAIIDDITDSFVPAIQKAEDEAGDIDDAILQLHRRSERGGAHDSGNSDAKSISGDTFLAGKIVEADLLQHIGESRKKVMGLARLLGNKADVVKGFSKRCSEYWDTTSRTEIGMYLGDIQDHIITMNTNLGHYEQLLSRSHSNYLAQINIRMGVRQEQTADTLGKLTVLGTIVLPMNIITGLWGMNVWVPGQEHEGNLWWFWSITVGLFAFGMACYLIAKRVYRIV